MMGTAKWLRFTGRASGIAEKRSARYRSWTILTLLTLLTLTPTSAQAQVEPAKSFSPTTLKLPDGPGSVQGLADSVSVGMFSGQVEYSVPIAVPTTGGMAPSLALDYSGALGNGPVGVGWTLRV
ncbi:MAG: SpvB/TcaC N-terminal domain-containing protein, partial [Pseudomonadota bacterium]